MQVINKEHYNTIIQDAFPMYEFYPSILERPLENKCWNLNLPNVSNRSGIVLHTQDNLNVTQNGIFTELLKIEEFYADKNIKNVIVLHWNHGLSKLYNGVLKLVEFPTHSFDFIQNFSQQYNKWSAVNDKTFENNFMCLNGNPRHHRILVYNYLKSNNNAFVSISSSDDIDPKLHYKNYNFDNTQNFINLLPVYKSTAVNVITETMYYENCGIITEKTFQAFGAMQLPIVIGYKGIINDLRSFGFDMFDDILDNSYDTMSNDIRWKMALDLNKPVLSNNFNYTKLLPRLLNNQQYLLNGKYLELLLNKFNKHVNDILL